MTFWPSVIADAKRGLTTAQRGMVDRGCVSGDFSMATVRALKRRGLFHLVIDSPNGQCGFMRLTPLGEAVREALRAPTASPLGGPSQTLEERKPRASDGGGS